MCEIVDLEFTQGYNCEIQIVWFSLHEFLNYGAGILLRNIRLKLGYGIVYNVLSIMYINNDFLYKINMDINLILK